MSLPKIDGPIRTRGNKTYVDCYKKQEIYQEIYNYKLEELDNLNQWNTYLINQI